MLSLNLKTDYSEIHNLYQSLMVMRNTNPLIDKIDVYLAGSAALINDTDGIVYLNGEENRQLQSLMKDNDALFWVDDYPLQRGNTGDTIALLHDLPGTYANIYGSLVVHVNSRAFGKMVEEMNADGEQGASFILRKDGTMVTAGPSSVTMLERALMDRLKNTDHPEALRIHHGGQTYSVSLRSFVRTNLSWSYVTATSMENLTKPIDLMSKLIVGISSIGLFIAILLAWMASYRLYQPIRRLLGLIAKKDAAPEALEVRDELSVIESHWQYMNRESQFLQDKLERNLPALKEAFLLQLLQGHLIYLQEEDIVSRMENFDWALVDSQYMLAVMQVRGFSQNMSSFTEGDEALAAFAAVNIIEEMTEQYPERIGVVNFHDMTVGMLFAYPRAVPPEKLKSEFLAVVGECVDKVGTLLKLQVTATVGNRTQTLKELHRAYHSARQSLQYRDLHKVHQILDMEELLPRKVAETTYPFELEKEALQAIRMGLVDESLELTDRFYEELIRCSGNEQEVRDGMQQFLGSIHHTILESGYNPRSLNPGVSTFNSLSATKDTSMLPVQLKEQVIRPHCERMMKDRDIHLKQMVDGVLSYLHVAYSSDLSLELCAQNAGTTPHTLSRAFKQVVGTTFIEYVTDLRMNQARILLQETDLKINDIAERVGYQPSYFIRVFKKSFGMTPGQYREERA
ncbi:helix-turn-helix domain-containing protein [Paenibacillus caseinilyticus]|nr:helix-turn-helix domain-containing protein [Paenibacillus mucilaginosus]